MLKDNVCDDICIQIFNYYKMKIFEPCNSLQQKIWSFKSHQKPLIESLLCVLINGIKKLDSQVQWREKMLNFIVKYCENCMFCRAQVIIRGKTSHISWRHSAFLKSLRQRRWSLAISWRQNNGKMAEGIGVTWSLFYKTLMDIYETW